MTIRPPIQCCDQFNDQCLFSENSLCFIGTFCSELGAQNWWWSSLSIHRSMVLSFGSVSLFIFVRPQSLPLCITKFSDPSHFTISGWVKSFCKTFITIVGYYVLLGEYMFIYIKDTANSLLKGTIQGKMQGTYHPNDISKKGWSWKHEKYFCGTKHKSLNRSMSSERK